MKGLHILKKKSKGVNAKVGAQEHNICTLDLRAVQKPLEKERLERERKQAGRGKVTI